MKTKILFATSILVLTTLACNFSIQRPKIKTSEPITTSINEVYPVPPGNNVLVLDMGAGSLKIREGGTKMVDGKIVTNIPEWNPTTNRTDNQVTISQGKSANNVNIPGGDLINQWDLSIGTEHPISLEINAGAYTNNIIFGEIPLTSLKISDGAAQSKVTFDKVNPQVMQEFSYKTGASQVDLINLANANFEKMTFESGAGSYTLDFNGSLQRKADITIKSGLSNLKVIVPSGSNTTVNISGGVNNVSLKGTWNINGSRYKTQGSNSPTMTINIEVGVGNLELISQAENNL